MNYYFLFLFIILSRKSSFNQLSHIYFILFFSFLLTFPFCYLKVSGFQESFYGNLVVITHKSIVFFLGYIYIYMLGVKYSLIPLFILRKRIRLLSSRRTQRLFLLSFPLRKSTVKARRRWNSHRFLFLVSLSL